MNELTLTPCFGFGGCDDHAACARYHALEVSDSRIRWTFCPIGEDGKRTLFVPLIILRRGPDVERRAANAVEQPPVERRTADIAQEAA